MKFYLTIIFTIFFLACNSQSSKDTEIWDPVPKKVYSKSDSAPPDDAIVLFDGTDLSKWKAKWSDKESGWGINDEGSVTVVFDGSGGYENFKNFCFFFKMYGNAFYLVFLSASGTLSFFCAGVPGL